jgi:hypothetical protein
MAADLSLLQSIQAGSSLLQSVQAGSGTHPTSFSLDTGNPVCGDVVAKVPLVLSLRMSGVMPSWLEQGHLYTYMGCGRKLNRDLLNRYVVMSLVRSDDWQVSSQVFHTHT